jgi:hypothetical protein
MTSRTVRAFALGLGASALVLIAASCGSATSPTAATAGGGGGYAYAWPTTNGQTQTTVDLSTQSEFTSAPMKFSPATGTNAMRGKGAGLVSGQEVNVSFAQGFGLASTPRPTTGSPTC